MSFITNTKNQIKELERKYNYDFSGMLMIVAFLVGIIFFLFLTNTPYPIIVLFILSFAIIFFDLFKFLKTSFNSVLKFLVILIVYSFSVAVLMIIFLSDVESVFLSKQKIIYWILIIFVYLGVLSFLCIKAKKEVAELAIYCLNIIVTIFTALLNLLLIYQTEQSLIDLFYIDEILLKEMELLGVTVKELFQITLNTVLFPILCTGLLAELIFKSYKYVKQRNINS